MSEHFFCSSLSNIKSSDWNECVGNDHPFLQYEFLNALEKSNSALLLFSKALRNSYCKNG